MLWRKFMKAKPSMAIICLAIFFLAAVFSLDSEGKTVSGITDESLVQYEPSPLDPAEEQLDQVSEPVGEISEPLVDTPTETLDSVSETTDEASESLNRLTEAPEPLGEDSETIGQVGESLDQVSETAEEASENLPIAPEGDGSGLEYDTEEAEMPLGDREAEGRGIGDY
jgi:hypothetical protein